MLEISEIMPDFSQKEETMITPKEQNFYIPQQFQEVKMNLSSHHQEA
jgi:hypothetical protein